MEPTVLDSMAKWSKRMKTDWWSVWERGFISILKEEKLESGGTPLMGRTIQWVPRVLISIIIISSPHKIQSGSGKVVEEKVIDFLSSCTQLHLLLQESEVSSPINQPKLNTHLSRHRFSSFMVKTGPVGRPKCFEMSF